VAKDAVVRQGRRRPWLAFLLSLLAPGLGHLYAGSLRYALLALCVAWGVTSVGIALNVIPLDSPYPIAAGALLILATPLCVALHAALRARGGRPLFERRWRRRGAYLAYAIVVQVAAGEAIDWMRERVAIPLHNPTVAMFPTLQVGDYLYASKLELRRRELRRGDVVVVELARTDEGLFPVDERPDLPVDRFLKRIVALPGEVVEVRAGVLHIDSEAARLQPLGTEFESEAGVEVAIYEERLGERSHRIARIRGAPREDFGPLSVPPDRYFLLGDNRDNSYDSRNHGTVTRAHVVGIVSHLYFSIQPGGGVRWERLGRIVH
jgi:signal peptidase I